MLSPSCDEALSLLFGTEDSDDDESAGIVTSCPIPRVRVIASLEYGTQVVRLSADESTNINIVHAPSVQMSGCGASVHMLQPNHSTTFDHETSILGSGGVVWGCAPALCTVLSGSARCFSSDSKVDFSNKVVLELGAGTGALGLWIAAKWPTASVILTDLHENMNNLRDNIAANHLASRCVAKELVFGEEVAIAVTNQKKGDCSGVHVIVASDCQFSTNAEFLWKPFVATLASSAPHTQVFISLQERHGTRGERLEPFLNALRDLSRVRQEKRVLLSINYGMVGSRCCFSELLHPLLEEDSQFNNSEYPTRCFYLLL